MRRFANRTEAGRDLVGMLRGYAHRADAVVLALPRGGVPVACEVAEALDVPLDVLAVRKLVLPGTDQYALGAMTAGGPTIDWRIADVMRVSDTALDALVARERADLERCETLYRAGRPPLDVEGRMVIVVDDGLATGTTAVAAILALRKLRPAFIVAATPVASREAQEAVRRVANACITAYTPPRLYTLGLWYEDFSPITDADVLKLLRGSDSWRRTPAPGLFAHA
jgi:predicted phosphoribosyltransferase